MEFGNPIVGEESLIRSAIKSPNYIPGSAGWRIAQDGTAEFTGMTINSGGVDGSITIENGEIIVRRSSDNEIIARVTSQGDGGFITRDPDDTDKRDVELTSRRLTFNKEINPAQFGGEIDWTFNAAVTTLNVSSGRLAAPANEALLFLSSNTGGPAQSTLTASNQGPHDIYLVGSVNINNSGLFGTLPNSLYMDGVDQGRGVRNYTNNQVTSAATVAEIIAFQTPNVEFLVGRAYKVIYHYGGDGNTAGDRVGFRLRRSNLAGTSLFDSLQSHTIPVANAIIGGETSQIVFNNTGATLNVPICATVYRSGGAGTVRFFANAANPTWIEILDIGDVADYPNARPL